MFSTLYIGDTSNLEINCGMIGEPECGSATIVSTIDPSVNESSLSGWTIQCMEESNNCDYSELEFIFEEIDRTCSYEDLITSFCLYKGEEYKIKDGDKNIAILYKISQLEKWNNTEKPLTDIIQIITVSYLYIATENTDAKLEYSDFGIVAESETFKWKDDELIH